MLPEEMRVASNSTGNWEKVLKTLVQKHRFFNPQTIHRKPANLLSVGSSLTRAYLCEVSAVLNNSEAKQTTTEICSFEINVM